MLLLKSAIKTQKTECQKPNKLDSGKRICGGKAKYWLLIEN